MIPLAFSDEGFSGVTIQ